MKGGGEKKGEDDPTNSSNLYHSGAYGQYNKPTACTGGPFVKNWPDPGGGDKGGKGRKEWVWRDSQHLTGVYSIRRGRKGQNTQKENRCRKKMPSGGPKKKNRSVQGAKCLEGRLLPWGIRLLQNILGEGMIRGGERGKCLERSHVYLTRMGVAWGGGRDLSIQRDVGFRLSCQKGSFLWGSGSP